MAFAQVEALCKTTPEGRAALDTLQKFGVKIVYATTNLPASYVGGKDNTCTLDNTMGDEKLASYFVHEMTHARQQNLGKSLDIATSEKADYVKNAVDEEFLATAFQMQFFVRLDIGGSLAKIKPLSDRNAPPRYDQYKSAFDFGFKRAATTETDPDKRISLGLGNANQMLKVFIYEGGLGVGAATYRDFYARKWREAHP
ncbi:hypothetical protein OPKNFCMD_2537 [Methylobacterium crusticola]|uniref:DUF4157 domain-containing protein n=1 Tax=Methylobacterium crusticola TaxID=1697972 RepID=A0ABQ4QX09_9HYPH|nr:DUF6782 family putative metallopeptidase [Methylobacterium crusticola]GJD49803.1 hypothetical protein OPKNFCMD_2537 [Methylobacterium crusticola]